MRDNDNIILEGIYGDLRRREQYWEDADFDEFERLDRIRDEQIKKVIAFLESIFPQLAEAAISVFNSWDQDDDGHSEEYGSGGICDKVAEEMSSTFESLKQDDLKDWYGFTFYKDWQCHTDFYIVNHEIEAMMEGALHPSFYESGGGYTWKKNKEHSITHNAFNIDTGFDYDDYFDEKGEMKGY